MYAMKRMRKSAVVQCPEHVFCEQAITRNTAHMFCIRCELLPRGLHAVHVDGNVVPTPIHAAAAPFSAGLFTGFRSHGCQSCTAFQLPGATHPLGLPCFHLVTFFLCRVSWSDAPAP